MDADQNKPATDAPDASAMLPGREFKPDAATPDVSAETVSPDVAAPPVPVFVDAPSSAAAGQPDVTLSEASTASAAAGKPFTITPAEPSDPVSDPVSPAGSEPGAAASDAAGSGSAVMPPAPGAFGAGTPAGAAVPVPLAAPGHKRRWLLSAAIVIVVLAAAAGGVFGLYLPNRPDNVWKTGMDRTGHALDSLIQSGTTADKLAGYKTADLSGSASLTMGGTTFSGTLNGASDHTTSTGGLSVTLKGGGQSRTLGLKGITKLHADSAFPDVYFQASGYKGLGLENLLPGIDSYDGQWIEIGSDYLQSTVGSLADLGDGSDATKTPSAADYAAFVRAVSGVAAQYVLTSDPSKAIITQKSFVGKEKVDGVGTYHYKAALDQSHTRDYCVALNKVVYTSAAYQKISGQTASQIAAAQKRSAAGCSSEAASVVKDAGTFDVWMNGHTKLLYKIRMHDREDPTAYTEIGENYQGGNKLSLFVNGHDKTGDASVNADIDLATDSVDMTFNDHGTGNSPYTAKMTLHLGVTNKPVTVTPPANPVPFQDVLNKLGLGGIADSLLGGVTADSTQSPLAQSSADSERQTDIEALDAHLEAYYAENGFYPTLAQLNNPAWAKQHLHGFGLTTLQVPDGTSQQLAAAATHTQYGYTATGCNADGCSGFTVVALLSDGTTYAKSSNT